jgi:hypothetical protein
VNDVLPVLAFIVTVTGCSVAFMVARAWVHRLKGPGADDRPALQELDDVRAQLAAMQGQLAELAERQEFTERMLAKARERGQLGAGGA